MSKRIVICADGTWNRPEEDPAEDYPTNVLRLARAIQPFGADGMPQQVFYDWGIGSYHDALIGGATGRGLHKNIMDDYRYIVQNYSPDDEIYLFGFSRGAYTVRCLCGLINNCGILKRPDAMLIQAAFKHYKNPDPEFAPSGDASIHFRAAHSHPSRQVKFVGVWDTVGAMGIPISFLGLFEDKDEFYDTKLGRNVSIARHALAIDEFRRDFKPTIWEPRENVDIQQVWFSGAHSNVGGCKPDKDGSSLSDYPLQWMADEAGKVGLTTETHLKDSLNPSPLASIQESRRSFYRLKKKLNRKINHGKGLVLIHQSVKLRWEQDRSYRPLNLKRFLDRTGWNKVQLVSAG